MLLQSAQQSQYLDFIGTPHVLCGTYYCGFGVGLSIMHFRRALPTDEVATTESGVNMWDFSYRNALSAPPRATSFSDLIGALSAFHKFAKYFYNKNTKRFIGDARDFTIANGDSAPSDPVMARILTHWVNTKFSRFRSQLVTIGLRSAPRVRKEFSCNDDQLVALKKAYPSWKIAAPNSGLKRGGEVDTTSRSTRQTDYRQPPTAKIPASVVHSLPKGDDGRRLCLRYVSKAGCNAAECARSHFKPDALSDEAKTVIAQRWKGLSAECRDL